MFSNCASVYVGKFKIANLKTSETIKNWQIAKITVCENYDFYSTLVHVLLVYESFVEFQYSIFTPCILLQPGVILLRL